MNLKTHIEDLQRLLEFCIYEIYEKKNSDFDAKYYLNYISKRLEFLISNKLGSEKND